MNMSQYNEVVLRKSDKWLCEEDDYEQEPENVGTCFSCGDELYSDTPRYEFRSRSKRTGRMYTGAKFCEDCFNSFTKVDQRECLGACLCCGKTLFAGDEYYTFTYEEDDDKDLICVDCMDEMEYKYGE